MLPRRKLASQADRPLTQKAHWARPTANPSPTGQPYVDARVGGRSHLPPPGRSPIRGIVQILRLPYAYCQIVSFLGSLCGCARHRLNMYRLTAKTLLLVLLAGTFTPFAAALSMQSAHPHCQRKPVEAPIAETPCHHHAMAGMHHDEVTTTSSAERAFNSKSCCEGHQCCRPLVRSKWAQLNHPNPVRIGSLAAPLDAAPRSGFRTSDVALSLPARAPPAARLPII